MSKIDYPTWSVFESHNWWYMDVSFFLFSTVQLHLSTCRNSVAVPKIFQWCSLTSGIVRLLQKFSNGALSLPELRGCSEKILMVFSLSENRVAAPMLQTVPLFRRCGCFHFATPFSVFDLLCFACGPPSAFSSRLPFENRPRSPPSEKQSPQISISLLLKTIFLSKQSPNLLYFSLPFKTHLLELFIANSSPSSWGVFLSPNFILCTSKTLF